MTTHVDGPVSSGPNPTVQWNREKREKHEKHEKRFSASRYWIAYSEDYHFENMI